MNVSILVCTYNRHQLLRGLLESLAACQPRAEQVVVVNGGDYHASQVVREFIPRIAGLKLVECVNYNLARSRNIGLAHCSGEIIAMTDDDAEVFPDWVAQIKRLHAEYPAVGAIGGAVLGKNQGSFVARVADVVTFPHFSAPQEVRTLPGVNISYKRAAIEAAGSYDDTLFRGEDVDLNWRVKLAGYPIYYHPAMKVYHFHRPTLRGLLRQHYMYGRAYYLVRRKWPTMYSVYPHRLSRPHDLLKAAHFVAALTYQPLQAASKLGWRDRGAGLPVLIAQHFVWKAGMAWQALHPGARQ